MTDALLLVMADGVRPDVLQTALLAGELPAIAKLVSQGALHTITTSFPSVTGPAYLPFLMGEHPARLGMPGFRWFDRSRTAHWAVGNARSYSGIDIWRTHNDAAREVPTLFDLATPSLASMSIFSRGATLGNIGRSLSWMIRSARPHFGGHPEGWRKLEQSATKQFLKRFERKRPRFGFLAINTPDKYAHRWGADSPEFRDALRDVDAAVASASDIAERGGWRNRLAIWIISDHGHSAVSQHEDLHAFIDDSGYRVLAHPNLRVRDADVALMVGGNSMAHLYVEPERRKREWWRDDSERWPKLHRDILERPAVDFAAVALAPDRVRISTTHGTALITAHGEGRTRRYDYITVDGDPLALGGTTRALNRSDAWEITRLTQRPDAIVQLAALVPAARSGDIVISAAPGWDLRSRFEPVPHVSTHGALLAEQMLVPLVLDRPVVRTPQRTIDVMPSALELLGLGADPFAIGESFL